MASNNSPTLNLSDSPLPQNRYTLDEALESIGYGRFQRRAYVSTCLTNLKTYNLSHSHTIYRLIISGSLWASNAAEIVILTFILPILKDEWNLPPGINGIIGASVFVGMLFGTIFWIHIGEKYGRILAIRLCIIGQMIFGIICAVIPNIYWFITFRFFVGFCLGGYVRLVRCYLLVILLTHIYISIKQIIDCFQVIFRMLFENCQR